MIFNNSSLLSLKNNVFFMLSHFLGGVFMSYFTFMGFPMLKRHNGLSISQLAIPKCGGINQS
jgi:hypothetical protein